MNRDAPADMPTEGSWWIAPNGTEWRIQRVHARGVTVDQKPKPVASQERSWDSFRELERWGPPRFARTQEWASARSRELSRLDTVEARKLERRTKKQG